MISCTEFIPMYSEFFKYLEKKGGQEEVLKYWNHISDTSIGDKTNPHSLASFVEKLGGFEGAIAYWSHTLTEEACDMLRIIDWKKKTYCEIMRNCPSRGMLNQLKHIEPYHNYCGHCNVIYSRVLEKYGIVYEMDFSDIENARCKGTLYVKGNPPSKGYDEVTDDKTVIDMKSDDNKYLHRDFHLLGDNALKYCGETFGDDAVIDFLTAYTKNYYSPIIAEIKEMGINRLKEWIETVYEIEEASELLHCEVFDDTLVVTIDKSPVIEYMHSLNQEPSRFYIEETNTLYKAIADECDLDFELDYYKENGAARFTFRKK